MSDELLKKLIEEQRKTRQAIEKTNQLLFQFVYNNLPANAHLDKEQVALIFRCEPSSVGRTKETRALTPISKSGQTFYLKYEIEAVLRRMNLDPQREAARILRSIKH